MIVALIALLIMNVLTFVFSMAATTITVLTERWRDALICSTCSVFLGVWGVWLVGILNTLMSEG